MSGMKIRESDLRKPRRKVDIDTATKVHPDKRKEIPRKKKHKQNND